MSRQPENTDESLPDVWQGDNPPDVWTGPEPEEISIETSRAISSVGEDADTPKARDGDQEPEGWAVLYGTLPRSLPPADAHLPPHQRPDDPAQRKPDPLDITAGGLVGHVIVPSCIVAMVSSLLFFLYDVRSVYLPGAGALKWLGFCFVVATVLIARFGRLQGNWLDKGLLPAKVYSFLLAGATLITMALSPWEAPEVGLIGPLSNGLIIFLVWRFASSLTVALSADLDLPEPDRPKLYGLERLEMERLQRQRQEQGPVSVYEIGRRRAQSDRQTGESDPQKAASAIARLTVLGLLIFAIGEPALLAGHELAGRRALTAMMVFLGSAALLSAAAGSFNDQRRLQKLGGIASVSSWIGRLVACSVIMVLILALALGTPGISFQGSGEIQSLSTDSGRITDHGHEGQEEVEQAESEGEAGDRQSEGEPQAGRESARRQQKDSDLTPPLLAMFAKLGEFLRLPLMIVAAVLALYFTVRFLPVFFRALASGNWRGFWAARWAGWWRKLGLGRGSSGRVDNNRHRPENPFRNLQDLTSMPPKEAVAAAYGRLHDLWLQNGYEPPDHLTPGERIAALPAGLRALKEPSRGITEIYLRCVFGTEEPAPKDRQGVVTALKLLQEQDSRMGGKGPNRRR